MFRGAGIRISAELCVRCKGYKRLCGLPYCPLMERFRAMESFGAEDQEVIIKVIDAMIVKKQVEGVIQPHLSK